MNLPGGAAGSDELAVCAVEADVHDRHAFTARANLEAGDHCEQPGTLECGWRAGHKSPLHILHQQCAVAIHRWIICVAARQGCHFAWVRYRSGWR